MAMKSWSDGGGVAIDPGLRGCGYALFGHGGLIVARYIPNPDKVNRGPLAHVMMTSAVSAETPYIGLPFCVEFPRIYPGVRGTDQNDLLDVAGVASAISTLPCWDSVDHVFPSDWKGQAPKAIMNRRVFGKLSEGERKRIIDAGSKNHNTLDAIGIGLYMLKRLG